MKKKNTNNSSDTLNVGGSSILSLTSSASVGSKPNKGERAPKQKGGGVSKKAVNNNVGEVNSDSRNQQRATDNSRNQAAKNPVAATNNLLGNKKDKVNKGNRNQNATSSVAAIGNLIENKRDKTNNDSRNQSVASSVGANNSLSGNKKNEANDISRKQNTTNSVVATNSLSGNKQDKANSGNRSQNAANAVGAKKGNKKGKDKQKDGRGQKPSAASSNKTERGGKSMKQQNLANSSKTELADELVRNPLHYQPLRGKLKIIFLGGVGEIGKNMTAFEYGDSIVIIDGGMTFPGTDMPGVDVVIPDVTYLVENRHKIKGILLTHGHEDHIGAVPFIARKLGGKIDVYGTKLTLGLVENKLLEHNALDNVNLVAVSDKSVVSLADFTAEFIHVSHSVAGSVAICLRTPVGTIFHTGDFKIDYTPLGNEIMNLNRIAEIGRQGVMLLMSESTNVEKPGYTMSESVVEDTINKVFQDAKGRRIIIATFASNVDRLGMIIELARQYKRKIAISGRSMAKYIETAVRVGQMSVDANMIVDIDKIGSIEDGKLVILSTGSQGEPMSALTRMASGEFNKVTIGNNDTIIISATPIPGNERDVYSVINKLYRLGAVVVYSALSAVHVSGHACQEELKLIYTLVKPKYFIPVHGEYRHLKQHAMLVEKLGHKKANIIIPEIGDCVEMDKNTFKVAGQVVSGSIMVDGLGVGDVGNIVLKDRLSLAEEGILVCVVGIDKRTGKLASAPEVVSRGCFFAGDTSLDNPADEVKQLVADELNNILGEHPSVSAIKTAIQRCVRKYFRVKLKRNPMVLPVVMEV